VEQDTGPPYLDEVTSRPRGAHRKTVVKLALLASIIVVLAALAWFFGLTDHLTLDGIREATTQAGPWGVAVYVAAFIAGGFLQVPGTLFVVAAVLIYGRLHGAAVAWVGAVASVTASFLVVRSVGGGALDHLKKPAVRRVLRWLDSRPIVTMIGLRFVFWMSPPINYALAMTSMRTRHYVVGSMLGLAPPMVAVALAVEWVIENLL
jgi:uncharacterized membrane protein YdjX (TVP38/TMEM64 family)